MKTKEEHAALMFNLPNALEIIRTSGIDELHRQMQAANVERKQNDATEEAEEPKQEVEETSEAKNAVFAEVIEATADNAVAIDEIKSLLDTQQKAYDTKVAALEAQVKAFKSEMDELRDELSLTSKRASQDPATKLSGADEKELKAVKTDVNANQYDTFFGDMNVPVKGGA